MNIYNVKGEKIESFKEFVEYYENLYYYNCSYVAEERIENILEKGIQTKEDAYNVLAWKLGGIDMNKTNSCGKIHYNKSWIYSENGKIQGTYQGGKIELTEYLKLFTGKSLVELKGTANDGANTLDLLKKDINKNTAPKGMGATYMITLLYFLNQGKKYPIYDKFAHIALKVILADDMPFGTAVEGTEIKKAFPDKTSDNFGLLLMNGKYKNYMALIEELNNQVEIDYFANRSVDRALWTYGHLFNIKE